MFSAASEAFGAVRTLSALTEHAKSEEEGRRTSEPLGSLIGGVLANQRGVWGGGILCAHWFSTHSIPAFSVFMLCISGMRLVVMSVQDKLICVRLVMPHSMSKRCVSMQLFCQTVHTRGKGVVREWSDKAVRHLSSVWGP